MNQQVAYSKLLERILFKHGDEGKSYAEKLTKHYTKEQGERMLSMFPNYQTISLDDKPLYHFGWYITEPDKEFQLGCLYECEKSELNFDNVLEKIMEFAKSKGAKSFAGLTSRPGLIAACLNNGMKISEVVMRKELP